MKSALIYLGEPRRYPERIAALEAENERLRERLNLLDPEADIAMMLAIGDGMERLCRAMGRLSHTHRLVLQALVRGTL